nr:DegT/DnrJ/EryC1/StrS family aminotransferase [Methylogaea oryzae]
MPRRQNQATHRPFEKLRFCGRNHGGGAGHQRQDERAQRRLGLLQLQHIDRALARRWEIDAAYRKLLRDVPGIRCLQPLEAETPNHAYFPILVEAGYPIGRDDLYLALKRQDIHPRRYFYPLISDFPMYRGLPSARRENLPVASAAAQKVLCLPIHPQLSDEQVQRIAAIVANP